jgi:hypothetical protein
MTASASRRLLASEDDENDDTCNPVLFEAVDTPLGLLTYCSTATPTLADEDMELELAFSPMAVVFCFRYFSYAVSGGPND